MTPLKHFLLALTVLASTAAHAGDLGPEVVAKFLKAIVASTGGTKIGCSDPALKAALEAQGVIIESSAPIVWCISPGEAKALKSFGKLVVTNRRDLAASASVILEDDGGRPKLLLNTANLHAARVQLGDAILKIAEKL